MSFNRGETFQLAQYMQDVSEHLGQDKDEIILNSTSKHLSQCFEHSLDVGRLYAENYLDVPVNDLETFDEQISTVISNIEEQNKQDFSYKTGFNKQELADLNYLYSAVVNTLEEEENYFFEEEGLGIMAYTSRKTEIGDNLENMLAELSSKLQHNNADAVV